MSEAFDWISEYPAGIKRQIDIDHLPSVAGAIEATCKRYPNKPAITCMNTTITYRQFNQLAEQFAAYLQRGLGLKKGDRIAIMLPNILQFPIAFFAAQKLGLVCVNTNPLYTPREMKHQFCDSGVKAIVIIDLFMDKLEKIVKETSIETIICTNVADQLPLLKGLVIKTALKLKGMIPKHGIETALNFNECLRKGQDHQLDPAILTHDDIALLQYTGGTTGVAKGAILTQKNILANMAQISVWSEKLIANGCENILTALPLYHIFALSVNFLSFISMGTHIFLVPKPIPIANTVAMFRKYRIDALTGVNTLFNALCNDKGFNDLAPRSIKLALAGGMALQKAVSDRWQSITGIPITEGFGLTEASPVTHCNPLFNDHPDGSIGVPLPSTEAKIVDDNGNEVAHGQEGELIIRGPQIMKGYWQRPEETQKTLRDGWLWTGDMAKRDEKGYFYIVDRKKDMILVSGFNVYPNEIEDVLVHHPKVLEAAVIGIKDERAGEKVKAFIVKKDQTLTEEELRNYCKENLTNYKRPRIFEFRDDLPKTNVGKILRRALKEA